MTSTCSNRQSGHDDRFIRSLSERLVRAGPVTRLKDLLQSLHWTDITVTMDSRPLLEDLPDLADRFRGAFGRALERLSSSDDEPWQLLFGRQLSLLNGVVVRPYLLRAWREKNHILCVVRLFGFADCWKFPASQALYDAAVKGIAIRMHGKLRLGFRVLTVQMQAHRWRSYAPTGKSAHVTFLTPLILRRGDAASNALDTWYIACLRRLEGVARWCDISVAPSLKSEFRSAHWSIADEQLQPVSWIRYSSSHRGGRANIGFIGTLQLNDLNELNMAVLQSAELFHAGGGATSGNGDIRVRFQ